MHTMYTRMDHGMMTCKTSLTAAVVTFVMRAVRDGMRGHANNAKCTCKTLSLVTTLVGEAATPLPES